jgi:hypothetical protein
MNSDNYFILSDISNISIFESTYCILSSTNSSQQFAQNRNYKITGTISIIFQNKISNKLTDAPKALRLPPNPKLAKFLQKPLMPPPHVPFLHQNPLPLAHPPKHAWKL